MSSPPSSSLTIPINIPPPPADDANCRLLGPFALAVQAAMGIAVVGTLVWKRQRERPKRKWRIWILDISKQLLGQLFVHTLNILLSSFVASNSGRPPLEPSPPELTTSKLGQSTPTTTTMSTSTAGLTDVGLSSEMRRRSIEGCSASNSAAAHQLLKRLIEEATSLITRASLMKRQEDPYPTQADQPPSKGENPCSLYFLNILVDTTLGVFLIYLIMRYLTHLFTDVLGYTGFVSGVYHEGETRPSRPELRRFSSELGRSRPSLEGCSSPNGIPSRRRSLETPTNPPAHLRRPRRLRHHRSRPSYEYFFKQLSTYLLAILLMKLAVLAIFAIFPFLYDVARVVLGMFGTHKRAQLVFVLAIFPLGMNTLQFWLIDSLLRHNPNTSRYAPVDGEEGPDGPDGSNHSRGPTGASFESYEDFESEDEEDAGEGRRREGGDPTTRRRRSAEGLMDEDEEHDLEAPNGALNHGGSGNGRLGSNRTTRRDAPTHEIGEDSEFEEGEEEGNGKGRGKGDGVNPATTTSSTNKWKLGENGMRISLDSVGSASGSGSNHSYPPPSFTAGGGGGDGQGMAVGTATTRMERSASSTSNSNSGTSRRSSLVRGSGSGSGGGGGGLTEKKGNVGLVGINTISNTPLPKPGLSHSRTSSISGLGKKSVAFVSPSIIPMEVKMEGTVHGFEGEGKRSFSKDKDGDGDGDGDGEEDEVGRVAWDAWDD